MGEYIRYANLAIKKGGPNFNIPIAPEGDEFNLKTNLDFMRVLSGDSAPINHPKIIDVKLIDSTLKKPNGQQIPEVVINYNERAIYHFGGTAIMESMAYIGESYLFPENEAPATFPYKSAELVTGLIYPNFAGNILNVFALCDVALMTGTPGSWFLGALNTMKTANFLPKHPKEVYEFFSNNVFDYGGQKYNTIQSISILSQISASYLKGYYTSDSFVDNIKWFDHILNHALGMRHNNIAFPLDILLHGSFYNNPVLNLTMKNIGSPLQLNLNDAGAYVEIPGLQLDNFRPEMNWAMAQVERVFAGKTDGCQMKTFCKESCYQQDLEDFTDDRCNTNPWSRALDNSRCPFVVVLELWQLQGFQPVLDRQ